MKPDSIAYAIAGMCFGIILGWVIGTQQLARAGAPPAVATAAPAAQGAAPAAPGNQRQAPPLDQAAVQTLTAELKADPNNADAAVKLANTYFDAEQYGDAAKWYEQVIKLDPKNVDASTDLGVSYYYTNRTDEALKQFDASLKIDPRHTKTLLNQGIVLAFGRQNLEGAAQAWQKVVDFAPNTPEAQAAQRGLEGIAASRQGGGATPPATNQ
jgi:tetratricopeptide (TPR) repeat protein